MADRFAMLGPDVINPARKLVALTAHDSTNFTDVPKAIYVGTGGTVVILAADDSLAVTLTNVPSGAILPIQAQRINATSTTASGFVGLY
jgi:hypothetical protein